jgi:hypothetical protein
MADKKIEMPKPQDEHRWLMQLVGQWDAEVEMCAGSDKPLQKSTGTQSVRAVGGFWILAENAGTYMDKPFAGIMTLGYDSREKAYVGTWVDSMTDFLWVYRGARDAGGNVLTLEAECPFGGPAGATARVRETVDIKSSDHYVFTSRMQGEDGAWVKMMTATYRRK